MSHVTSADIHPHHARDAIAVLDACNLSGVVKSLDRMIQDVRGQSGSFQRTNDYPPIQLFAAKIIEMTNMGLADTEKFHVAYAACKEAAARME